LPTYRWNIKEGADFILKILIIRPAALGDTLMLMPAIAQLRASADVVLVVRSPGLYFLKPHVDLCIDYEGPGWHRLFLDRLDNAFPLPVPPVDKVIAFLNDPEGKVGHNLKTELPNATVHLFPSFPPKDKQSHVAFYLAQCLQRAGLPIEPSESIKKAYGEPLLGWQDGTMKTGKIILHPGSGGKHKNYPPQFWLQLIEEWKKRLFIEGNSLILLLGPAEAELHRFFGKRLDEEGIEIILSPEPKKLVFLLRQAPLYMGHDSGITHLAAMLGTPTIALFKDSPLPQWRPLGPAVKVIERERSDENILRKIFGAAKELIRTNRRCS
jgi:ADP-heptose:LPS heptosyltransferase